MNLVFCINRDMVKDNVANRSVICHNTPTPSYLIFQAFVKFSGAPVTFTECQNPWKSGTGTIPFFKHNGRVLYGPDDIITYLRQKVLNEPFILITLSVLIVCC